MMFSLRSLYREKSICIGSDIRGMYFMTIQTNMPADIIRNGGNNGITFMYRNITGKSSRAVGGKSNFTGL